MSGFTAHNIWSVISDFWSTFQDTWSGESVSVFEEEGSNLAMGPIPMLDPAPYGVPVKKRKKTIELTCIVGTKRFVLQKDTKENEPKFKIEDVGLSINQLTDPEIKVTAR
jgi:hypothetical protein